MDEQIARYYTVAIVSFAWLFLVGFLFFIFCIPQVHAETIIDDFSINSSANYTGIGINGNFTWDPSGVLKFKSTSNSGAEVLINKTFSRPQRAQFNITFISGDAGSAITFPIFVFCSLSSTSGYFQKGNKYGLRLGTTVPNQVFQKTVAGAVTSIDANSVPMTFNTTYNVTILTTSAGIRVWINDYTDNWTPTDNTFVSTINIFENGGYSGFASSRYNSPTGITTVDYLQINNSISSDFTCTSYGCTQSGSNFADPGVSTRWMTSDGQQYTTTNLSKTFTSGTWSVALNNQNVAGSSSEFKPDYVTISPTASTTPGPVINPPVKTSNSTNDFAFIAAIGIFILAVIATRIKW